MRFRNYVLIILLLAFGLRRGEVLSIKVSDVNLRGRDPSLSIVRRPGDEDDRRAIPPSVKTLGRELPGHPHIARILNEYVQHHRPQFPNADDCTYFSLSELGHPLSLRMVNSILQMLVSKHVEFSGILTPHVLRYTYNDTLTEAANESGLDGPQFEAAQNYLNGWSPTSTQGRVYARTANEKRARQFLALHQGRLLE